MRVAFRLSLLQSTWFEGGMQSIGLAYCLIPGLRSIYPNRDEMRKAVGRYDEPFNTHPFLVGVIAGALLKMEEKHTPEKEIICFSTNMMGVLAAFGDPFFRSALPIFVTAFSCLAAMLGGVVAGIVTLLVLFNVVHFTVRFGGITIGYRDGCDVILHVAKWMSPARTRIINRISAVGSGLVLVTAVLTFGAAIPGLRWPALAAFVSAVLVAIALTKWRPSQNYAIPVVLVIVVLVEVSI